MPFCLISSARGYRSDTHGIHKGRYVQWRYTVVSPLLAIKSHTPPIRSNLCGLPPWRQTHFIQMPSHPPVGPEPSLSLAHRLRHPLHQLGRGIHDEYIHFPRIMVCGIGVDDPDARPRG